MSLIEVMLARKEVLISLMIVGLVLVLAIVLAVGPGIYRRWKKLSARRKAARAARQAEAMKAKAAKKKRGRAVTSDTDEEEAEADADAEEEAEAPAAVEPSGEKATTPAPAEGVAAQPEPGAEGAAEASSEEEKSEEEEKSSEDVVASAMQDILDSVFVDDDVSGRYDVLLQGIEVGSAEELLTMASRIAAELGTKRTNRGG